MICLLCHSNSVNTGSSLPNISDVKTRKRRNVIGIDMILSNRIISMPCIKVVLKINIFFTRSFHEHISVFLLIRIYVLILGHSDKNVISPEKSYSALEYSLVVNIKVGASLLYKSITMTV